MNISYPESLPVARERSVIREAVEGHQVVIVCGDTGSGKTTQLPKIALELGRGRGEERMPIQRIGCTQPRRLAATSVARRVANEMQVELGREVGYQIRFEDRTTNDVTAVKFMTDGILLAETRGDPNLRQYDTLIIDEAHERSLNIDFILGYLHRLLPIRPDLKVIISSATLDAETFAGFFGGAPVIEVEGRTFPVEDVYLPPSDDRERMADQVARAAEWLRELDPLGDTLVFLPGEREIRDVAYLLEGRKYANTIVLPLFARLAGKDQQAVFNPIQNKRRIILATNVAETSLTIPDIRSVIDSGVARVNRYDPVGGIQRLQIERISKASARQRRGRCGRVSDGICVRLYDEDDFEARSDYTDPEILRSNLAGVVLQMEHLRLGDPLQFPFVDKPQPKRVAQAYRTLEEIGAIWKKGKRSGLTEIGRTLARLPLDPRVGRILVEAREQGCLREGLIIASALTVQDPRERPQDLHQQADQAHALFRDKRSDFTGWLRWWHAASKARRESNNALRRFCQKHFLNFRRLQEWINLHRELREVLRDLRWELPSANKPLSDPADTYSEPLHRSILAAIPSHIGCHQGKKGKGYKGARDKTFHLFPGSGVFRSSPAWVMAFEMVETAKLYARNVAMFDPAEFEKVAPHLCRYRYSNPQWNAEQGAVYGEETVIAFGLPIVERRRVHYGRIDPVKAREIFILEALVNGETRSPLPMLARNRQTIQAAEMLEHKLRRHGGLVHPDGIVAFYNDLVPQGVCTQKAFEQWASQQPAGALDLSIEDCIVPQVEPVNLNGLPDELVSPDGETRYPLRYLHDPENDGVDGMTLSIPLADLPHLPEWFGDWLVPGWLPEKAAALFRALHKDLRRLLPAHREVVDRFLSAWDGFVPACSVVDAVIEFLRTEFDVHVAADAIDLVRMPVCLSMRFEVVSDDGVLLGAGRDLVALQANLASRVQARFSEVSRSARFERDRVTRWSFGDLPESVQLDRHTAGYPGLCDSGNGHAGLKLWPCESCARSQHRRGLARLFRLVEPEKVTRLETALFLLRGKGNRSHARPDARPARTVNVSRTPDRDDDGFGSLANAFGGSRTSSRGSSAKPDPGQGRSQKQPAPSDKRSDRFLATDRLWLLDNAGSNPGRNRDDLVTLILMETLGKPRTSSGWLTAVEKASRNLFDTADRVCANLSRIFEMVEVISRQLDDDSGGAYAESIADARDHFDRLLMPGWLLGGVDARLAHRVIDFQGLELRLTRMKGSPAAKDLSKLERFRKSAAAIWAEDANCECGTCIVSAELIEQLDRDFDMRLREFAPELRSRVRR